MGMQMALEISGTIFNLTISDRDIEIIKNANDREHIDSRCNRIWEKIVDWFCGTNRAEAKKLLFDILSKGKDDQKKESSFNRLRQLASPAYQDNFKICEINIGTEFTIHLGKKEDSIIFVLKNNHDFSVQESQNQIELMKETDAIINSFDINNEIIKYHHESKSTSIQKLREEFTDFLKEKIKDNDEYIYYINDALSNKFNDIPAEDDFWNGIQGKRSSFDFKIKTEVFPSMEKDGILQYISGEKKYSDEQKNKLIDILFKTDKTHPYTEFAQLFCKEKNIDFSKITFKNSHFFITGKDKEFIPDDGNCFFHCIDYLNNQ